MADEQSPTRRGGRGRRLSVVAAGTEDTSRVVEETSVPAVRRRTNSQEDKVFIEQAAVAGELKAVDGHLIWSGRSEDLLHPYQVPTDERRCRHVRQMKDDLGQPILDVDLNPLKERCPKWAMLGANICVKHAKGSKAVMDEAREMIAGAAPALVGQLIKDALDDSHTSSASDRIKAINSLLDRFGLRGGIEVGPDMPAWREIMEELGKEMRVDE